MRTVPIDPDEVVAAVAQLPAHARAAINDLIVTALTCAPDVTNAFALLVTAVGEFAEIATQPRDLRLAAVEVLDEWPDRPLRPSQRMRIEMALTWLGADRKPPPLTADEVIAAAELADDRHDRGPAPVVSELRLPDPPAFDDHAADDFDPEETLDGGDGDD